MSTATTRCQLDRCERAASTKCFCCTRNICTRHFMEHIETIKTQIDPLVNDINEMVENIRDLTLDQITEPSFAQLHQWRDDMHRQIEEIFSAKNKEIEDLIATNKDKFVEYQKQQLENIMKTQDQVRHLVEEEDVTIEQIQSVKTQLATVQTNLLNLKKDFLSVKTRALLQGLVTISSNLNKPVPANPQPYEQKQVRDGRNSECTYASLFYSPILPMETPTLSPVRVFCGELQNHAGPCSPPSETGFIKRSFPQSFIPSNV